MWRIMERKMWILTFLIAPLIVFGEANDFSRKLLPVTTNFEVLSEETKTATAAAAANGAESTTHTMATAREPSRTSKTTTFSLPTSTTLASLNAPATIVNTASPSERNRRIVRKHNNDGSDDKDASSSSLLSPSTTKETASETNYQATTIEGNEENGEQTRSGNQRNANDGGSATKEFQRNAQVPTTDALTNRNTNAKQLNHGRAANQTVLLRETEMHTLSPNEVETTSTSPTTIRTKHDIVQRHEQQKLENGLYRIELAEIVTNEFRGGSVNTESRPSALNWTGASLAVAGSEDGADGGDGADDATKRQMVDLYPVRTESEDRMSVEDGLRPLIRDANDKLLRERTIYTPRKQLVADTENKIVSQQSLMTNEREMVPPSLPSTQPQLSGHTAFLHIQAAPFPRAPHDINRSPYQRQGKQIATVSDFTGKLLAEQDGVITEIEQKFHLNELEADSERSTALLNDTKKASDGISFRVNHQKPANNGEGSRRGGSNGVVLGQMDFIERRVKKSFEFPMHRAASEAAPTHIGFANTKFSSSQTHSATADLSSGAGSTGSHTQPEFSTTKFYNSKELYNELLQRNKAKSIPTMMNVGSENVASTAATYTAHSFVVLHSPELAKVTDLDHSHESLNIERTTTPKYINEAEVTTVVPPSPTSGQFATSAPGKIRKVSRRAKLLLNAFKPSSVTNDPISPQPATKEPTNGHPGPRVTVTASATSTTASSTSSNPVTSSIISTISFPDSTTNPQKPLLPTDRSTGTTTTTTTTITTTTTTPTHSVLSSFLSSFSPSHTPQLSLSSTSWSSSTTNPPKSTAKPIVRPRILNRLQERINSLECEIGSVPQDSHLWHGNETHELLLPIMATQEKSPNTRWTPAFRPKA